MRRIALVGIAAGLILAPAGCGGDDDSTTTEASSSTTTQTSTATVEGAGEPTEFLGATLTAATAGEPGVVVVAVAADSLSRLKAGDVIVEANDKPVASPEELLDVVGKLEFGGRFTIRVVRGSKRFTLAEVQSPTAFLGTEVKDAAGDGGAKVVGLAPGGPAEKAGVEQGDVIIAVDDVPVRRGDDLVDVVGTHAPGDEVTITVVRGTKEMDLSVTLVQNPGPSG